MQNRIGHRFQRRADVPVWLERAGALSYFEKVLSTAPANLIGYWVQDELAGGVAIDHSPEGNDGAYTGVILGQPGIGDGRTCPFSDGATGFNDIFSAGLDADFNGAEGTMAIWFRVLNAGVWTDTTFRTWWRIQVNGANTLELYKDDQATSRIFFVRGGGGVFDNVVLTPAMHGSPLGWTHLAWTWSEGADETRAYLNGQPIGPIQTGLGVWAGALQNLNCSIGSSNVIPARVSNGFSAHGGLWTIPLTAAQIAPLGVR